MPQDVVLVDGRWRVCVGPPVRGTRHLRGREQARRMACTILRVREEGAAERAADSEGTRHACCSAPAQTLTDTLAAASRPPPPGQPKGSDKSGGESLACQGQLLFENSAVGRRSSFAGNCRQGCALTGVLPTGMLSLLAASTSRRASRRCRARAVRRARPRGAGPPCDPPQGPEQPSHLQPALVASNAATPAMSPIVSSGRGRSAPSLGFSSRRSADEQERRDDGVVDQQRASPRLFLLSEHARPRACSRRPRRAVG